MKGVGATAANNGLTAWAIVTALFFCAPRAMATQPVFPGHMKTLKSAQTVNGFRFLAGTEVQVLNSNGRVTGVIILHEDRKVDGHWLKNGTHLTVGSVDGQPAHLLDFVAVPGQRFHGIHLPAETQVDFDAQGRLADMSSNGGDPVRIQGMVFAGNSWIEFHPSGRVKSGQLAKGIVAQGLHVQPGPIEFHANGHIKQAWIGAGSAYRQMPLAHGNRSYGFDVEFWPNGQLKQAFLEENTVVNGKYCPPGHVAFKPDGSLDDCDGSPWMR